MPPDVVTDNIAEDLSHMLSLSIAENATLRAALAAAQAEIARMLGIIRHYNPPGGQWQFLASVGEDDAGRRAMTAHLNWPTAWSQNRPHTTAAAWGADFSRASATPNLGSAT